MRFILTFSVTKKQGRCKNFCSTANLSRTNCMKLHSCFETVYSSQQGFPGNNPASSSNYAHDILTTCRLKGRYDIFVYHHTKNTVMSYMVSYDDIQSVPSIRLPYLKTHVQISIIWHSSTFLGICIIFDLSQVT